MVPPDLSDVDGGADLSVVDLSAAADLGVEDLADGFSADAATD